MTTHHTDLFDSAFGLAAPVIEAASQADANAATPCSEFTVADLLAHLNAVGARIVALGQGRPAGSAPDSLPSDDYPAAWAQAAAQVRSDWHGLAADAQCVAPWRTMSADEAADIYAAEVLVHAWDLAVSCGAPYAVPDEAARVAIAAYQRELPPPGQRAAAFAQMQAAITLPPGVLWHDPFAEGPGLSAGMNLTDQMVALAGRDPRWNRDRPA